MLAFNLRRDAVQWIGYQLDSTSIPQINPTFCLLRVVDAKHDANRSVNMRIPETRGFAQVIWHGGGQAGLGYVDCAEGTHRSPDHAARSLETVDEGFRDGGANDGRDCGDIDKASANFGGGPHGEKYFRLEDSIVLPVVCNVPL
jgi:hypothetical protein